MNKKPLLIVAFFAALGPIRAQTLEEGFKAPPDSAKPQVPNGLTSLRMCSARRSAWGSQSPCEMPLDGLSPEDRGLRRNTR